jgi:hypothetical protein
MTIEQFRAAVRNPPFRPFDIHLADGRSLAVSHPEQVAINPGLRTVHLVHADGSWSIFDLLLVTDLEFSTPPGDPEVSRAD